MARNSGDPRNFFRPSSWKGSPATGARWLELLARLGYAARGVVYLMVGGLALLTAAGQGGATTDSQGAVIELLHAPGGWLIVLVMALGLLGHSLWRFCQAIFDADGLGRDARAWMARGAMLVSGIVHLLFAAWAGLVALGLAAARRGSATTHKSLASQLMSLPLGPWIVGLLGLLLIGVGVAQILKGRAGTFDRFLQWDAATREKLMPFCRAGLWARGIVFAITGGLIVYAAVKTDPAQAGGIREALEWLRSQPYGRWLLGLAAAGLICFGIFSGVQALYRLIRPQTSSRP